MKNAPCMGCGKRELGCHSVCEKYAEWRKDWDAEKSEADKKRRLKNTVIDVLIEGAKRVERTSGKFYRYARKGRKDE